MQIQIQTNRSDPDQQIRSRPDQIQIQTSRLERETGSLFFSSSDRCPVAPPPHSCLRSGPIRSRRVTFSQDSEPREEEEEEEEDPGGGHVQPLMTSTSDLDDVTHHSQEVGVSDLPGDGRGHTWSGSLQCDRKCGRGVGVLELSVVLGGLLQLVDQYWTGPGSLQRHQQFLGGAYDLLSELLQPAGGRVGLNQGQVRPDQGQVGFSELVLLRRKLERSELQLEALKSRLLTTLKENYELRRRRHFN